MLDEKEKGTLTGLTPGSCLNWPEIWRFADMLTVMRNGIRQPTVLVRLSFEYLYPYRCYASVGRVRGSSKS